MANRNFTYKVKFDAKFGDNVRIPVTDECINYCALLQSVRDRDTNPVLADDGAGVGDASQLPALVVPKTVSPECFKKVREWCDWHAAVPDSDTSDEEDEKNIDALIMEYLPKTKISPWDSWFCKQMKMAQRMEVAECATVLGNDEMVDTICRFIANYLKNKTPEAIRKIFRIPDSRIPTREEEETWKEQYGWALVGCTDDRGEDTEDEEERAADAKAEEEIRAEDEAEKAELEKAKKKDEAGNEKDGADTPEAPVANGMEAD